MSGFTIQVRNLPSTFPITDPTAVEDVLRQVTDQVSHGFQHGPVRNSDGDLIARWTFDSHTL